MNPSPMEALVVVDKVCRAVSMPRAEHETITKAINVLSDLVRHHDLKLVEDNGDQDVPADAPADQKEE